MRQRIGQNERPASGERIAKAIARAGLCSRRQAETWIAAGRVAVNGEVIASPARNVTADDRIAVDGEPLPGRERTQLFLYHKPRGLLTTHADPGGRPTIFAALPAGLPRLISVGRLDLNTEGLLLLTNDGSRARARPRRAGSARGAARRHHHRRHPLWFDRGYGRSPAGQQRVAHLRDPGGQEPRGEERARSPRA